MLTCRKIMRASLTVHRVPLQPNNLHPVGVQLRHHNLNGHITERNTAPAASYEFEIAALGVCSTRLSEPSSTWQAFERGGSIHWSGPTGVHPTWGRRPPAADRRVDLVGERVQ
ncbi:hypothetical protein NBRGN_044_00690 [Nocardia brasiliensis NBRC 14402]|nr:hypothetical protein NBRGN_044_00690 [Nocardia brasiliensis NBRC 14402]